MNESAWQEEAIRRSSEWLDSDDEEPATAGQDPPLESQSLAHIADLQLVDALLASLSDRADENKALRVRRVMQAIDDSQPAPGGHANLQNWRPLLALAACLLVGSTLFWFQFSPESRASEVLLEISEVTLEETDRVYKLSRVSAGADAENEYQGKLYLRGVQGFVVVCGDVVLGRNGNEFWFVSPHGKVTIGDDFAWMSAGSEKEKPELELLKELSLDSRQVPLMQLPSVVELMQHEYDLTLDSGAQPGQPPVDVLTGTRRNSGAAHLPNTIRLWSGKDSRIIQRAEFSWEEGKEETEPNKLVLELTAAEQVPTDWYNHETHHPDGWPLRRISPGS